MIYQILTEAAFRSTGDGSSIALLTYKVSNPDSPKEILLESLESAYQAGVRTAGWNVEELRAKTTS